MSLSGMVNKHSIKRSKSSGLFPFEDDSFNPYLALTRLNHLLQPLPRPHLAKSPPPARMALTWLSPLLQPLPHPHLAKSPPPAPTWPSHG
ncbi:hypothetical protein RRG08_041522 [Elysia crispata]|uniref:Uncharacterized protein n=1 Tax=Elysia crispata TaxID=231223 RepID=A0AAE0ZGE2_9GAST|nr:hypothetical protein RRG08_041522 [Elysia crispata]